MNRKIRVVNKGKKISNKMNLIESESDDEQLVDISVDLEMSQSTQSTQSTQSSLVADLKVRNSLLSYLLVLVTF